MAKRSFQYGTWTPTSVGDATNFTNGAYQALVPGTSTSLLWVSEIFIGGQATSSSVSIMMFARDSTLGVTPVVLNTPAGDGPLIGIALQPSTAASTFISASTVPQRSNSGSGARLNLSFNSFGGIVRWVAYPGEEWQIFGTTAGVSESSLSAYTGGGTGAIGSHIIYEPF